MRKSHTRGNCTLHPTYHQWLISFFTLYDQLDNETQETILLLIEIWAERSERRRWQTRPLDDDEPVRVLGRKI